jgi:hypothetical protein
MATIITYVHYIIFFADQAEYNAAVVTAGGNGWGYSPENAAATFGITWPPAAGDWTLLTKGFLNAGDFEIVGHVPSPTYLTTDVDSLTLAQASTALFPTTKFTQFVWWGNIVYQHNQVVGGGAPATPIPQRRFIGGFEHPGAVAEGGSTISSVGRSASRVTGGKGFRIRGNSGANFEQTKQIASFRAGLTPKTSWERIYIRINQLGTNELNFYYARGNNPGNEGCTLRLSTAGVLLFYQSTGGAALGPLVATSPTTLLVGKWYLLDILLTWPAAAGDVGGARLYINHVLDMSWTVNTGVGMDRVTYHQQSTIGQSSTRETDWEIDFDDWINADVPNNGGVESLDSIDWVYGSHVRTVNIKSANVGTYTEGGYPTLNQYYNPTQSFDANSELTSATALDTILDALTDEPDDALTEGLGIALGPVASIIEINAWNSASQAGTLSYKLQGGAYVDAVVTASGSHNWLWTGYVPVLGVIPPILYPFYLKFIRPNSANTTLVNAMSALVEYVGAWGLEDDPLFPIDLSNNIWHHNAPYANTYWALFPYIGPVASPTFAVGATYVGNDTYQVIDLPSAPHFIWIRGVTAGSVPIHWFAASMGPHTGGDIDVLPYITVWADATGFHFSVEGVDSNANTNGRTYQYIAFCDPGMRFNYCDAYSYAEARATVIKPLFDTTFIPQAGFVQGEILQALGGVIELAYKGPGHAGNTGVNFSGVELANFGSFAAGALTIKASNLNDDRTSQYNFSLWKTTDNAGWVMTQLTSYVGDGDAFRVISLPLTTGRYPLLAIVIPNNGTDAYFRDPSHTGNNSQITTSTTNSTTAIVGGGKDQLFVGTTINTVGVTYEIFIILGDSAGWNNGIFPPGYELPGGIWIPPPFNPSNLPIIIGDGGMNFDGEAPFLGTVNMSGIYTLVPGKTDDTFYTGIAAATVDVKKPDPTFKTGYIGG